MGKRITVTTENNKGRNTRFRDNLTGRTMTRAQFVDAIKHGE